MYCTIIARWVSVCSLRFCLMFGLAELMFGLMFGFVLVGFFRVRTEQGWISFRFVSFSTLGAQVACLFVCLFRSWVELVGLEGWVGLCRVVCFVLELRGIGFGFVRFGWLVECVCFLRKRGEMG